MKHVCKTLGGGRGGSVQTSAVKAIFFHISVVGMVKCYHYARSRICTLYMVSTM